MVFVIQCAGRKRDYAGTFIDGNGSPVMFVADPKRMADDAEYVYAHPDGLSDSGITWREQGQSDLSKRVVDQLNAPVGSGADWVASFLYPS